MSKKQLTLQQAAERLGISRMTVWRMIQDGRLKANWNINRFEVNEKEVEKIEARKEH